MTGPHPSALTRKIIAMHKGGLKGVQIAQTLGCTAANVSSALKRHKVDFNVKHVPLSAGQILFIQSEADKSKVSFDEMARAMLADHLADVS